MKKSLASTGVGLFSAMSIWVAGAASLCNGCADAPRSCTATLGSWWLCAQGVCPDFATALMKAESRPRCFEVGESYGSCGDGHYIHGTLAGLDSYDEYYDNAGSLYFVLYTSDTDDQCDGMPTKTYGQPTPTCERMRIASTCGSLDGGTEEKQDLRKSRD